MKTASIKKAGASPNAFRRLGAVICLMVVAAVGSPAQTNMEDRIAAMEALLQEQTARILQLDQELAASQGDRCSERPVSVLENSGARQSGSGCIPGGGSLRIERRLRED